MPVRNKATPQGRELGKHLARFCDEAEPKARLRCPELPPRCNSCAFREGLHVANGSPQTLMDALKCVLEGRVFECHEPGREDWPCMGWAMLRLAADDNGHIQVSWPFSNEPERDTGAEE